MQGRAGAASLTLTTEPYPQIALARSRRTAMSANGVVDFGANLFPSRACITLSQPMHHDKMRVSMLQQRLGSLIPGPCVWGPDACEALKVWNC